MHVEPANESVAGAAKTDMIISGVRDSGLINDILHVTLSLEGTRILLAAATVITGRACIVTHDF